MCLAPRRDNKEKMDKQVRRTTENCESMVGVHRSCNNTSESNGAHLTRGRNNSFSGDLKSVADKNFNGTPESSSGLCRNPRFDVPHHNCLIDVDITSTPHQEAAEDMWTKEFFSNEESNESLSGESGCCSTHQREDGNCFKCGSAQSLVYDCRRINDGIESAGGKYPDISDQICSQDLRDFSCYQQELLDKEGGNDEDNSRLAEEDFFKPTGGKRSRKGKSRNNTRDELRKDGRHPPFSSGKQKLGRKKSQGEGKHQLRAFVPQPLLRFSNYCIQVLIDLVLLIGECVEALGTQLYIRIWLPAHDLGSLRSQGQ